jgi:hypothetical protein
MSRICLFLIPYFALFQTILPQIRLAGSRASWQRTLGRNSRSRKSGVKKGLEYALLTDELNSAWSGMTTREYKKVKDLKKESLRDSMTNAELVLNMLAELSTTEIAKNEKPHGFHGHIDAVRRGGNIAGDARKKIEYETGKPVITGRNAKELKRIKK